MPRLTVEQMNADHEGTWRVGGDGKSPGGYHVEHLPSGKQSVCAGLTTLAIVARLIATADADPGLLDHPSYFAYPLAAPVERAEAARLVGPYLVAAFRAVEEALAEIGGRGEWSNADCSLLMNAMTPAIFLVRDIERGKVLGRHIALPPAPREITAEEEEVSPAVAPAVAEAFRDMFQSLHALAFPSRGGGSLGDADALRRGILDRADAVARTVAEETAARGRAPGM